MFATATARSPAGSKRHMHGLRMAHGTCTAHARLHWVATATAPSRAGLPDAARTGAPTPGAGSAPHELALRVRSPRAR